MKRVLVTGASGFVGKHTIPALIERGFEVHAVVKTGARSAWPQAKTHVVDLLDDVSTRSLLSCVRPSHLLHLAWTAKPGTYWADLDNLAWLSASLNLLRIFVDLGGQRVVGVGTAAEYDWRYGYCSELTTPLLPRLLYGSAKNALRSILESVASQERVSAGWGRIFFLYGPGEPPGRLVSSVACRLLNAETAPCTTGEQYRDFLYVEDAARALVALLDCDVAGPVNIASGHPVQVRALATRVAEEVGRPDLLRLGAVQGQPGEPPLLVADVSRLRDEVSWQPRYSLETGISKTVEWWRRELGGKDSSDG